MIPDLRVCFVGDSFVAGAGDPRQLGWVGRIAARTHDDGQSLTCYNLGVRRDTSDDVLARWRAECTPRLPAGCTAKIVVSFGVNDTVIEDGHPRVDPGRSAANLSALVTGARQASWPVLVVGPVPVADGEHNRRTRELNEDLHRVCRTRQVRYVDIFDALHADALWMRQVAQGDGAHPATEGYQAYAEIVWPHFSAWIAGNS